MTSGLATVRDELSRMDRHALRRRSAAPDGPPRPSSGFGYDAPGDLIGAALPAPPERPSSPPPLPGGLRATHLGARSHNTVIGGATAPRGRLHRPRQRLAADDLC